MSAFRGFDLIRVINLPSRPDRRAQMTSELRRLDLDADPRVRFVDGVKVEDAAPFRLPGEKGIFLAQLRVIKEAAAARKSVLILEDDVDFTPAAASWSRSPDCDIAYGGYLASNPEDLAASDIIGAHCMGISARAAVELVPFLEGLLDHPSPPPIDGAYVWFRRQRPDMIARFANPVVAGQRSSRSDISPARLFDKLPLLRDAVQLVRRARWKVRRTG